MKKHLSYFFLKEKVSKRTLYRSENRCDTHIFRTVTKCTSNWRILSILALWARAHFWGALGIIVLMSASQLTLVRLALREEGTVLLNSFNMVAEEARMSLIFRAALGLMGGWLLLGAPAGRNLIGRLRVREVTVCLLQAVSNVVYLAALWAAEVLTALGAFRIFSSEALPGYGDGLSLFIAVFDCPFLHWILPVVDRRYLAAMLTAVFAIGLVTAVDAFRLRRGGRLPIGSIACLGTALVLAGSDSVTASTVLLAAVAAADTADMLIKTRGGEGL